MSAVLASAPIQKTTEILPGDRGLDQRERSRAQQQTL